MHLTLFQKAVRFFKIFGLRLFVKRFFDISKSYILGLTIPLWGNCKRIDHSEESARPSVILFSCIEWNCRFQRPQHLSCELARLGYNVYYCSPSTIPSRCEGWHIYALPKVDHLWHVRFFSRHRASLNECAADTHTQQDVSANIQHMVNALSATSGQIIAMVEHPLWFSVLQYVKGVRIVYDCLDDYASFSDAHEEVTMLENRLAVASSVIVSTADGLATRWHALPATQKIIRNACCYEHFSKRPSRVYAVSTSKVIGYHGAIEDWFDVGLVEQVAQSYPQHTILLVGGAKPDIAQRLKKYRNIHMTGEIPYAKLPYYVHAFDVGLLPFRICDLTLNTNPVKIYEYFAAGLPVVAVNLPEMKQFADLIYVGCGQDFVEAVGWNLLNADGKRTQRQDFAQKNSWAARGRELVGTLSGVSEGQK